MESGTDLEDVKEQTTITIYIFGIQVYRKTKIAITIIPIPDINISTESLEIGKKPIGFIPGSNLIHIPEQ